MVSYINFVAESEPWNYYELEDKTILKTRFILIKVILDGVDEANNPIYSFNSDTILGALVPDELTGEPHRKAYTLKERMNAIEKVVKFKTKKEDWNKYKLADGTLLEVKLALVKVTRTTLYDARGDRLYLINTQPLFKVTTAKELELARST